MKMYRYIFWKFFLKKNNTLQLKQKQNKQKPEKQQCTLLSTTEAKVLDWAVLIVTEWMSSTNPSG